eukprot:gene9680-6777_t
MSIPSASFGLINIPLNSGIALHLYSSYWEMYDLNPPSSLVLLLLFAFSPLSLSLSFFFFYLSLVDLFGADLLIAPVLFFSRRVRYSSLYLLNHYFNCI